MTMLPSLMRTRLSRSVIFSVIAAVLVFSTSCKKSSSSASPIYYIKATIDGKDSTFSSNAAADLQNYSGAYALILTASGKSSVTLPGFSFNVTSTTVPIALGTYTSGASTDYGISAVYVPTGTNIGYAAGISTTTNPFSITITQLDSKTVKGTFSGDLFYIDNSTGQATADKKTLTNGEFYLKIY